MTEVKKMERFVITRAYSQMDIVIVEVDPDKHGPFDSDEERRVIAADMAGELSYQVPEAAWECCWYDNNNGSDMYSLDEYEAMHPDTYLKFGPAVCVEEEE